MNLEIRALETGDVDPIARAFAALGWNKPAAQYERYLLEQEAGSRAVLVAVAGSVFAGYLTIVWESDYAPFAAEDIPEIRDFNVLPVFRRSGIGTRLMDEAEARIAAVSPISGIGVGMDADYGAAQRMYVLRGYVPDGRGLMCHERPVRWGEAVIVDDALALFFMKTLPG